MKISKESIWRGCEASFKLYNSFQRFWILNNAFNGRVTPPEYFSYILKQATKWSRGILAKNYNALGLRGDANLFFFSVLRHHGVNVPLLDFSRNPFVALFFGLEYASDDSSKKDISNYFSLYELTRQHVLCQPPFKRFALDSLEKGEDYQKEFQRRKEKCGTDQIDYPNFLLRKEMCEEFIHRLAVRHLYDPQKDLPIIIEDLPNDKEFFNLFSNFNIIAQDGLFVAYSNPNKPMEEGFLNYSKNLCQANGFGEEKLEEILDREKLRFRCFNIHKSLKILLLKFFAETF
ncbi:MAG: FRG domain-containing protein [Chitinophagales bacterium]|nr:FRG domain-containing protein [Chitinophagales bacterium]